MSARAVYTAIHEPESLTIIASPSERQSAEFLRKLGSKQRGDGDKDLSLRFPNGSRIGGLPGIATPTRGFSNGRVRLRRSGGRPGSVGRAHCYDRSFMLIAALISLVTAVTIALFTIRRWWLPEAINLHARSWDTHFAATMWIIGAVFLAAQLALAWAILRYRSSAPPAPESGSHGNNRLEWIWTTAAAILFVGLTGLSTAIWAGVHLDGADPNALRIEAVAKQFAWNFRYAGPDGKFGRTKLELINDANGNPFGLDDTDPAGRDDLAVAALRVPAGRPIVLLLRSRDVIHNFFVREMRIKQDLVPGMEIPLHFTADKPGTYEVACSELCGLGHHQMRTQFIVLEPAAFAQWQRETLDALGVPAQPETR